MTRLINRRRDSGHRGFTLIEILIAVAIIGVIVAILVPNLLDALQKSRQKRTLMDMRSLGTAWFSWLTDEMSAAAAGSSKTFDFNLLEAKLDVDALLTTLFNPDGVSYISTVPQTDGWGHDYDFVWAGDLLKNNVIGIRSFGRDGSEGPSMNPYPYGPFNTTHYEEDIVWVDGVFVRFPTGAMVR